MAWFKVWHCMLETTDMFELNASVGFSCLKKNNLYRKKNISLAKILSNLDAKALVRVSKRSYFVP